MHATQLDKAGARGTRGSKAVPSRSLWRAVYAKHHLINLIFQY